MSESAPLALHPVLLDNTVLSNFALVNRTELVMGLWTYSATTYLAWREYQTGITIGKLPKNAWKGLPLLDLRDTEQELADELAHLLGAGERTCLAIAHERKGLLVTDDQKARQIARRMRVPITGTLGLLVRMIEQEKMTLKQGNQLLNDMIDKGYHSPTENLTTLLKTMHKS